MGEGGRGAGEGVETSRQEDHLPMALAYALRVKLNRSEDMARQGSRSLWHLPNTQGFGGGGDEGRETS